MLTCASRSLTMAAAAVSLLCSPVVSPASDRGRLELAGLAVYTETARDIYIAGLLLPPGRDADSGLRAPTHKAMEYRIATRRLSSRGFAGLLLLQAEMGGDRRAPETVLASITALKRRLQGSLKEGDQFVIARTAAGETAFSLNGVQLHRVADGSVFDFFFAGWVGDKAAATFRNALLAGKLDKATAKRFDALTPSQLRTASVHTWVASESRRAPVPVKSLTASGRTETRQRAQAPELRQVTPLPTRLPPDAPTSTEAGSTPGPAPVQEVAAGLRVHKDLNTDDREYRRQFQEYVSDVMRLVYGAVKYPRRAIRHEWEGRVELSAHLDESGGLVNVVVDRSSGHARLDEAAQAAVKRAAPFPALTPAAREELSSEQGDGYIMAIPVTFALKR